MDKTLLFNTAAQKPCEYVHSHAATTLPLKPATMVMWKVVQSTVKKTLAALSVIENNCFGEHDSRYAKIELEPRGHG